MFLRHILSSLIQFSCFKYKHNTVLSRPEQVCTVNKIFVLWKGCRFYLKKIFLIPSIPLLLTFYESRIKVDFRNAKKCMFHSNLIFEPEVDLSWNCPNGNIIMIKNVITELLQILCMTNCRSLEATVFVDFYLVSTKLYFLH